jgi:hypothetical protein
MIGVGDYSDGRKSLPIMPQERLAPIRSLDPSKKTDVSKQVVKSANGKDVGRSSLTRRECTVASKKDCA